MSHVERKPERVGDKQGQNVRKGNRCPCAPFVLSFLLSELGNISFFTDSPYLQICRICTFSSLLQLVLYWYPFFLYSVTFRRPVFPCSHFFFPTLSLPLAPLFLSLTGSQEWTFQQTRAIKVALAGIYWEISVVLLK